MGLREKIQEDLKKTLKELTKNMSSFQSALSDIDFAEAEYSVKLVSAWEKEGEKSIETKEKATCGVKELVFPTL